MPANQRGTGKFIATVLFVWLLSPGAAQAYFDPNTGGLLYQILFPLVVAVVATWRYIKNAALAAWQRLKAKLGRRGHE